MHALQSCRPFPHGAVFSTVGIAEGAWGSPLSYKQLGISLFTQLVPATVIGQERNWRHG